MKLSGFTFVRNAILYDFPLEESLRSLLPLCDEVVVAVGRSEDETLEAVRDLGGGKIRIIQTVWDDALRQGGQVYAQQTDLALAACTGDWCIYLQADEVLHEADYDGFREELRRADSRPDIDALLLRYLHFYGSYDYLGVGRQWYRREIRAVRNTGRVISWGDAQGFRQRLPDGTTAQLRARQTDVRAFHYGWVKPPEIQGRKQRTAHRYWHDDAWIASNMPDVDWFDYASANQLRRYDGSHPAVMRQRIERSRAWTSRFDPTRLKPRPLLVKLTDWIEQRSGWRIGEYRNFIEV